MTEPSLNGGWEPTPGGLGLWTLKVPGGPALMASAVTALDAHIRSLPDGPTKGVLSRLKEACQAANHVD